MSFEFICQASEVIAIIAMKALSVLRSKESVDQQPCFILDTVHDGPLAEVVPDSRKGILYQVELKHAGDIKVEELEGFELLDRVRQVPTGRYRQGCCTSC